MFPYSNSMCHSIDPVHIYRTSLPDLRIRKHNSSLQVTQSQMMCEMGFKVGCWVERKKDKVQASVVALSDDNVKMQCDDGQMYEVSSMAFLEGQFKLMKQPKDPVSIENYEAHLAMNSKDVEMGITKGRVLEALVTLEKKHIHVHQHLRLHFKPQKDIVALKGFGKGKLALVPCTVRVENPTRISSGMIRLADKLALVPNMTPPRESDFTKSVLAPFWMVRVTHEVDESNMELHVPAGSPYKIPILRNSKDVAAGDVLVRYEEKKVIESALHPLTPCEDEPPTPKAKAKASPLKRKRTKST